MAEIRPFRGLRYNPERVGDLARVIAPPYDVITGEAQDQLYRRHPYNIIRLEYGRETPWDGLENNRYSRAAADFRQWVGLGILRQEQRPTIYVYEQRFQHAGQVRVRTGLIARLRVEDWSTGAVLPHEHTLAKPKVDRLNLLRACQANFSPIFSLYEDPSGVAREITEGATHGQPNLAFRDEDGEEHRIWLVDEPSHLQALTGAFATADLYIADGHHRYETALAYRDERHRAQPGAEASQDYDYALMVLVDLDDPGLVVLPTHRLIGGLSAEALTRLRTGLPRFFDLEPIVLASTVAGGRDGEIDAILARLQAGGEEQPSFGLYGLEPGIFHLLRLRDRAAAEALMPPERAPAWRHLDVSILHAVIVGHLLGISEANLEQETGVAYTRLPHFAVQAVQEGLYQLALFLNPTLVRQIRDVALAHERMPQKSTYFYPKLATGLVINPVGPV